MSTITSPTSFSELSSLLVNGFDDWPLLGDVRVEHMADLILFNYTDACQRQGRWNWFERVSRGLIMNRTTGEVVAKPFAKFFNYGEEMPMPGTFLIEATEKLDGSLGICFRYEGEFHVATRGSFTGSQALAGTALLKNYDLSSIPDNLTLLFEIIYPDNRVVVDYGDITGLFLIGARGRFHSYDLLYQELVPIAQACGFPMPQVYTARELRDYLNDAETLDYNHEGYVLRFSDGRRYKVKSKAYLEVAKILAGGFTYQGIVRRLYDGTFDTWRSNIPDEFDAELQALLGKIDDEFGTQFRFYMEQLERIPQGTRKEQAAYITRLAGARLMFALLDGKNDVARRLLLKWMME